MSHAILIAFVFALGACVGSFLNVVVWRLPRGESLVSPPSHCPKCNERLRWYDNVPIIGWLKLGGRCRFCRQPISPRYPIVELLTGLLFAFYYAMFFVFQIGPCPPVDQFTTDVWGVRQAVETPLYVGRDWPIYFLYMFAVAALLAASLIDAELYIIPIEIPWLLAGVGIVAHALVDRTTLPGALNVNAPTAALTVGATVGLLISLALLKANVFKTSFPQGEPLLEIDRQQMAAELEQANAEGRPVEDFGPIPPPYTAGDIRAEMRHEMLFLLPPLVLGGLSVVLMIASPAVRSLWDGVMGVPWLAGGLAAVMGGLWGAFVVWLTRILGTLGFGRVAMGLGDVHLMLGVGAVIGAGAVTVAFFLAPFFGLLFALYKLIARTGRELPYGPFLGAASAFVMLFYCPIAAYLKPGMQGLLILLRGAE